MINILTVNHIDIVGGIIIIMIIMITIITILIIMIMILLFVETYSQVGDKSQKFNDGNYHVIR